MTDRPKIKGNPLLVTVYLLVLCYIVGEFVIPKYPLLYPIHLIGILGLIISLFFFFSGFNIFTSYEENPAPTSPSRLPELWKIKDTSHFQKLKTCLNVKKQMKGK